MKRPSAHLQQWIRQQIGERARGATGLGAWPQQVMAEHEVLLVHGDNLTLWFLAPDGALFSLDTDRVARRLEVEANADVIRSVLAEAARTFPELRELVDDG